MTSVCGFGVVFRALPLHEPASVLAAEYACPIIVDLIAV